MRLKGDLHQATKKLGHNVCNLLYEETKAVTGKRFYSLKELRGMGFPYSKKFPENFVMDDRIINLQSGRLHRSIRWTYRTSSGKLTAVIWAGAPHAAKLVRGTDKMRERNFFSLAFDRASAKVKDQEEKFFREVTNATKR